LGVGGLTLHVDVKSSGMRGIRILQVTCIVQ